MAEVNMQIPKDNSLKRRFIISGSAAIFCAVLVLVVAVLSNGVNSFFVSDDENEVIVKIVERGDLIQDVSAYGELSAKVRRSIVNQVSGTVIEVVHQGGESVKQGDTIVRLANPEFERELKKAQLNLREAKASLYQIEAELTDRRLSLHNDVEVAKADVKTQKAELMAREKLAERNIISELELQSQRATLDKLILARNLAQQRLDTFSSTENSKIETATIKVNRAENQLHTVQENISALDVRAGMDGMLQSLAKTIELGSWLQQGDSIGIIADPKSLIGELQVGAADAALVRVGNLARVDINGQKTTAKVTRIAPSVINNQVQVDVDFLEKVPHGARTDIEVRSTIIVNKLSNRLLIPRPSHYDGGQEIALYRQIIPGKWQLIYANVEQSSRQFLAINQGLDYGDTILLTDPALWKMQQQLTLIQ